MPVNPERRELGKKWERKVSEWLKSYGHTVVPLYSYTDEGRIPVVEMPDMVDKVAPDLQVFGEDFVWVEVKYKSKLGVSSNRGPRHRTTGIDLDRWYDYCAIRDRTNKQVLIIFVQGDLGEVRCGSVDELRVHPTKYEHSRCQYGKGGMVFWSYDSLRQIGTLSQVQVSAPRSVNSWRSSTEILSREMFDPSCYGKHDFPLGEGGTV